MNRRRVLAALGTGVVGSLAGCGGGGSDSEPTTGDETTMAGTDTPADTPTDSPTDSPTDEPTPTESENVTTGGGDPSYLDWLPAELPGEASPDGISVTFEAFRLIADDSTPSGTPTPTPSRTTIPGRGEDPLLSVVLENLVGVAFGVGFAAGPAGLDAVTEPGAPTDRISIVLNSVVFEGSYDPSTLATDVTDAGPVEFDTYGGYTLYGNEDSADRSDSNVVALSEESIVVAISGSSVDDTVARIERILDAGNGDRPTYVSQNQDYAALTGRLPDDDANSVTYPGDGLFSTPTPDEDGGVDASTLRRLPLEGNAVGAATSSSLSREEIVARIAIQYASADAVDDRATLEETLGFGAAEQSVEIDGDTAIVSATYPGS